jgi:hypothetical protein
VVRALDASGRPVKAALVRFAPLAVGASGREGSALLTASSAETDADGLASVKAFPLDGLGTHYVRASVDGAPEAVSFTLTNVAPQAAGKARLEGLPTADRRGIVGQGQVQVVHARFDLPLAVNVLADSVRAVPGREVRFHHAASEGNGKATAGFVPEGGTPGRIAAARDPSLAAFVSLVTRADGTAMLTGRANGVAGRHRVVAVLVDPSPGSDNDPASRQVEAEGRLFTFDLENTADGVLITASGGDSQSQRTHERFGRPLQVRVGSLLPAAPNPGNGIRRGGTGLDGAAVWFIVPIVEGDKKAAATLLGGEDRLMGPPGEAPRFRVTEVPLDEAGAAEVTAFANGVAGSHRVIVAYPGDFTDPADARFKTVFILCNGAAPERRCVE